MKDRFADDLLSKLLDWRIKTSLPTNCLAGASKRHETASK